MSVHKALLCARKAAETLMSLSSEALDGEAGKAKLVQVRALLQGALVEVAALEQAAGEHRD